jgi:hypothetical protein
MTIEAAQHHHPDEDRHRGEGEIHFRVDGEPYTTNAEELTPNQIIKEFAGKDPATHYLVQIRGHEKTSYQGVGDVPIKLHDGERFQVISTGPTPVSDRR